MSEQSFAEVYDALYDDAEFVAARADFLCATFGAPASRAQLLLDAGCGTGAQARAMSQRGYRVIGLDLDPLMLAVARQKSAAVPLALGDLRRLPFRAAFDGILCLESPLAHLLDDADFLRALRSMRRALIAAGLVVIDSFDYPAALGAARIRERSTMFGQGEKRVRVWESHRYDAQARVWTMRQRFVVDGGTGRPHFEVTHRLKMRSPEEYAAGLERSGFEVLGMLPNYPGLPERLRAERRVIVVARAV